MLIQVLCKNVVDLTCRAINTHHGMSQIHLPRVKHLLRDKCKGNLQILSQPNPIQMLCMFIFMSTDTFYVLLAVKCIFGW